MNRQEAQTIKTIIIEDEVRSMRLLQAMLRELAPELDQVGMASDVDGAIEIIEAEKPDLIFLDIELCGELAFRILDQLTWRHFQLIFITAYENYALKAIRYAALDYLLKPIAPEDLVQSIEKVRQKKAQIVGTEQMEVFREHLSFAEEHRRITLPTLHGFVVEELDHIIVIEAEGNYSLFHMTGGNSILVSKNIQAYESLLETGSFFRIHRSYVVNLKHVKKYMRGRGGQVVMSDSRLFPVAIRKKEAFIKRLKQM